MSWVAREAMRNARTNWVLVEYPGDRSSGFRSFVSGQAWVVSALVALLEEWKLDEQTPGRVAYEAFRDALGNWREWANLTEATRDAWNIAAQAVLVHAAAEEIKPMYVAGVNPRVFRRVPPACLDCDRVPPHCKCLPPGWEPAGGAP